ncbi:MAG TPA: energy transducer TonB [Burkholderiales bacterium]|nr:energy transducer TonB [Burkholderiales bacterium]
MNAITRLQLAVLLSIAVHAVLLFGVKFVFPSSLLHASVPLQVVLVNSKSARPSPHPEALAQTNLDGGGNTDADRHLSSPLPPTPDQPDADVEPIPPTPPALQPQPKRQPKPEPKPKPKPATAHHASDADTQQEHVKQLENEARKLVTRLKSRHHVATAKPAPAPPQPKLHQADTRPDTDLLARSIAIARLQARIDKEWDDYQKRPRKRFIGARAKEYRFARYVEDWRLKMERIGTLNYPQAARREKIYGSLQLTVEIRSDGSLASVHVDRSSGYKVLDDAAVRIVHLAAPFAPFPPDIAKDTDILGITRIWAFTPSNRLASQ